MSTEDSKPDVLAKACMGSNVISTLVGATATAKGFRDDWFLADVLDEIADRSMSFQMHLESGEERIGPILARAADALRRNVIGTKLMLTVSELSEALESLRVTGAIGALSGDGNIGEELADAQIRIGDLADMLGIEIGDEVWAKMDKNRQRPHMHGKSM